MVLGEKRCARGGSASSSSQPTTADEEASAGPDAPLRATCSSAARCYLEGGALFPTEAARLFGATDAEVAEASAMGALSMFGSTFINAQQIDYEQFRKEVREIVAHVKKSL